jgi:hypothetical protein
VSAAVVIDPGHAGDGNACGAFVDGVLVRAWFERNPATFVGNVGRMNYLPPTTPRVSTLEYTDPVGVVVVERPALQGKKTRNARPQDLMNLAWSGALLAGAYAGRDGCPVLEFTPNDSRDPRCVYHVKRSIGAACTCSRGWKGSEPKPVQHARLWEELSPAERLVLGGDLVRDAIYTARERGALDRWGKPGVAYYPRSFTTHNLLDAAALGCTYLGRLQRTG